MTKQKEPITQNIRNRREHSSRFKVMFYVIGSEKSKSGFCFLQLPPTEPKAWWSSSVLPVYRYRVRQIRLSQNMFEHSYSIFMCGFNFYVRIKFHDIIILIATLIVNICTGNTCHCSCIFFMNRGGSTFCCCPLIAIQRRRAPMSTAGEARSSRPLTWAVGSAM